MKDKLHGYLAELKASLLIDSQRTKMQFISVYFLLAVVSAFMTVVNVFTDKYALMLSTLFFAVANGINLLFSIRNERCRKVISVLFSAEITALFAFFIISGEPEGFSAIWVCFLPASGLLLFGRKRGSILCLVELGIMLFCFYTAPGRALLRYRYTDSFLLRFPMLYVAFFTVAYFLETIRSATYEALQQSRQEYRHLYSHDALTNVYNRYGFNERMDALLSAPLEKGIALMILDIDFFKSINDRYGHLSGDVVLKQIAALLVQTCGQNATVCRWGGEEFAVIVDDISACDAMAQRILDGIRALRVVVDGEMVQVTASMGMSVAQPLTAVTPVALVTQTDRCLYRAKETGRDRLVRMPFQAARASAQGETA